MLTLVEKIIIKKAGLLLQELSKPGGKTKQEAAEKDTKL